MLSRLRLFCLMLLLAGCQSGAVVFAPTPVPPELAPTQYTHPSNAFSVLLPRTWSLYEQQNALFAGASFSPPNSDTTLLTIAVVKLEQDVSADDLGILMDEYQTQVRPDLSRYTEQSREAMGDGSWRITGLRASPAGVPIQINTFIERQGSLVGVIDMALPTDAALHSQMQRIVNTFEMSTANNLPVAALALLSATSQTQLEIVNLNTWTTPTGVFFVTGEVANNTTRNIPDIPIRAELLNELGEPVADAVDFAMGYAVEAGGFAPFSIRFGEGRPLDAVNYRVTLGNDDYTIAESDIVAAPNLEWSDATEFSEQGDLFITGEVTNVGNREAIDARAIVTVFDEAGRVIGTGFADTFSNILSVDETARFNVLIDDVGGTPANYVVNVQALPCETNSC